MTDKNTTAAPKSQAAAAHDRDQHITDLIALVNRNAECKDNEVRQHIADLKEAIAYERHLVTWFRNVLLSAVGCGMLMIIGLLFVWYFM